MSISRSIVLSLASALFAASCSSSAGGGGGVCGTDPTPPGCGESCSSADPCSAGLYCSNGECTADCTSSGNQCPAGDVCSNAGQCIPEGSGGDGDGDGSGDGDGDGGDGDGGDGACPAVQVNLDPVVPKVVLLIDQSKSMDDPFDRSTRWERVKDALIGEGDDLGVLFELQSSVELGATLYTSRNGFQNGATCPELEVVGPAINNAAGIAALLEGNEPVDDTPTAESVDQVVRDFPAADVPRVILLATDGNPDSCEDPSSNDDAIDPATQRLSENAVQNAFTAGLPTFVLSVGDDTQESHLQRLANAGKGLSLETSGPAAAPFFRANSRAELVDAFRGIIGSIRTCEINIAEAVDLGRADQGVVILNGRQLAYDTDWVMDDEHTLRLVPGAACDEFLSSESVELTAEFPCGGVIVD